VGPYHVLGFSDGGESALFMGIHGSNQIRTIVVWGAAGTLHSGLSWMLDGIHGLIDNPADFQERWRNLLIERHGERAARSTTQSWAKACRSVLDAGGDLSLSRVNEIRCPVLVIAGEDDPFAPTSAVSDLVSRIPNGELMIVPETGHLVHHERRDWFNDTVLSWLARQGAETGH
jgi:pimeloyl-ACP methyl ester carboxylesterase